MPGATLLACLLAAAQSPAAGTADRPAAPAGPAVRGPAPAIPVPATDADGDQDPVPDPARPAAAGESAQNAPMDDETDARWRRAVDGGLEWLARSQNEDGSFGRGRSAANAGIVSLCALAFMADGSVPGRGRHGAAVARALEYVLAHCTESGLVTTEGGNVPMYGHGFAALFLGEVYGMSPQDSRVRDALVRAIRLIENSQNEEGGWRYNPVPDDADVSVTICQVMALRSARNAGIRIPREVIDSAVRYVRECQNPDGGFRYMRSTGTSAWPRTAAGVASLFYAGVYEDDSIPRGLGYLLRTAVPDGSGPMGQPYYFYGHYYAAQAMYLAGGDWWREWWPRVRRDLLTHQEDDGSWSDPQWGSPLGTSMALIVLQMPNRYLPIFQK